MRKLSKKKRRSVKTKGYLGRKETGGLKSRGINVPGAADGVNHRGKGALESTRPRREGGDFPHLTQKTADLRTFNNLKRR